MSVSKSASASGGSELDPHASTNTFNPMGDTYRGGGSTTTTTTMMLGAHRGGLGETLGGAFSSAPTQARRGVEGPHAQGTPHISTTTTTSGVPPRMSAASRAEKGVLSRQGSDGAMSPTSSAVSGGPLSPSRRHTLGVSSPARMHIVGAAVLGRGGQHRGEL